MFPRSWNKVEWRWKHPEKTPFPKENLFQNFLANVDFLTKVTVLFWTFSEAFCAFQVRQRPGEPGEISVSVHVPGRPSSWWIQRQSGKTYRPPHCSDHTLFIRKFRVKYPLKDAAEDCCSFWNENDCSSNTHTHTADVSMWLPGSRWAAPAPKRKHECPGRAPTSSPAVTQREPRSRTMTTNTTSLPSPARCPPPCLPHAPTLKPTVIATRRW